MRLKHIWFDVDGTLYQMPRTLEERIFDKMFDVVALETGRAPENIASEYLKAYHDGIERVNAGKPLRSHTRVFKEVYRLDPELARRTYGLVDIPSVLEEDVRLQQMLIEISFESIPLSIYSNNYHAWIANVVRSLGLDHIGFKYELNGEGAYPKNGTTSGFERALELSRAVSAPHEVLFVGDRVEIDIEPASRAGMTTAHVRWDTREEPYTQIDERKYELRDIYSLTQLVSHLQSSR